MLDRGAERLSSRSRSRNANDPSARLRRHSLIRPLRPPRRAESGGAPRLSWCRDLDLRQQPVRTVRSRRPIDHRRQPADPRVVEPVERPRSRDQHGHCRTADRESVFCHQLRCRRSRRPRVSRSQHRDSSDLRAAGVRHRAPNARASPHARSLRRTLRQPRVRGRAAMGCPSVEQRGGRLPDGTYRIVDGAVLPVDDLREHPRGRHQRRRWRRGRSGSPIARARYAVGQRLVRPGRPGVRSRHGVQGIDGHRADRRRALRSGVRVRLLRRGLPIPSRPVRRPGGDVGRSRGVDVVWSSRGGRRLFDRHFPVDLSLEPDADDRALPAPDVLAAIARGVLRVAGSADAS